MQGRTALRDERGFTLIEVLVVILIIGILAAIALPQLSGKKANAQDADAKTAARSMLVHVESCFVETEDYRDCETGDALLGDTRMPIGGERGEVSAESRGPRHYIVTARSHSGTRFFITKSGGSDLTHTCDADAGGCRGRAW